MSSTAAILARLFLAALLLMSCGCVTHNPPVTELHRPPNGGIFPGGREPVASPPPPDGPGFVTGLCLGSLPGLYWLWPNLLALIRKKSWLAHPGRLSPEELDRLLVLHSLLVLLLRRQESKEHLDRQPDSSKLKS